MKRKTFALGTVVLALAMAVSMAFAGCAPKEPGLTDEALKGETLADFTQGEADSFIASDGWTNGSVFNTYWTADSVTYADGAAHLRISENPNGSVTTNDQYFGGELRSTQFYGYGDYEVRMKASGKMGTASTFFVCTGDYDYDAEGNPNPWDEIDIEFLGGKRPTEVQFNYYVNGEGGHEYWYDLGFDATKDFHNYGFRWTEDSITWFVDGKPVYKVTADGDTVLPSTEGKILMNYWCGTPEAEGWMGEYSDPGDESAQYQWVKTTAQGRDPYPAPGEGDEDEPGDVELFEGDWSEIAAVEPEFVASEGSAYQVTNSGTSSRVTYEGVSGNSWHNVKAVLKEEAADTNWVHLTLKNDGKESANIRVNVRSATAAINSYGLSGGELLKTADGTFIDVPAGETVEMEIKFEGVLDNIELMIDSARQTATIHSGDITVSDIKFAKQGEIVIPEEPESNNDGVTINGEKVVFVGDTGGKLYIINTDAETNSMNVTYSGIAGGGYKNINAPIAAIAGTHSEFTMKVTNNGTESITLRVDIISQTQMTENTKACNVSATQDGNAVYTDLVYGGSAFTVAAGATSEIKVIYDTTKGPQTLQFMIDSNIYNDTATHSGDVTFSELAFGGEAYVPDEPGTGTEEPDPDQPGTGTEEPSGEGTSLAFTCKEGVYTITPNNIPTESLNVKYSDLGAASYETISAAAADLAAGKDTFTIKIKNNGTESVIIRVDVLGTDTVAGENGASTAACNVSAVSVGGTEVYTDTAWGGSFVTVAADEEVTFTVTYNGEGAHGAVKGISVFIDSCKGEGTRSGDVTLSGFAFSKAEA